MNTLPPIAVEDHAWAEKWYPTIVLAMNRLFYGHVDLGGNPYIQHLLAVAGEVDGFFDKVLALLHDFDEDIGEVVRDQCHAQWGTPPAMRARIDHLSRKDRENYFDYIRKQLQDASCRRVKLADNKHNMDLRRLPSLGDNEIRRVRKYHRAYRILIGEEP